MSPMMPTFLPVKSTPPFGHVLVWYVSPWKLSRPSKSGVRPADRQPVAMTKCLAEYRSPWSVSMSQRLSVSSNVALVTAVSNCMSLRRSNLSATCDA